jgi:hypothetical protein
MLQNGQRSAVNLPPVKSAPDRHEVTLSTHRTSIRHRIKDGAAVERRPSTSGPRPSTRTARVRAAAVALGVPWWTIAPFGVTDELEPGTDAHPGLHVTETGRTDGVPFRINASLSPAYRGDAACMLTDVRT